MTQHTTKRPAAVRHTFTAALLLAGALPAAGAEWQFPAPGSAFYDIGTNWSAGTVPGAGEPTDFVGMSSGVIGWDDITGDTTSASITVSQADIVFLNATNATAAHTHTTVGNTTLINVAIMTVGNSADEPMFLNVGNDLDIRGTAQFNARFASQVTVGNELFVGNAAGQTASAAIDGVGTQLTVNAATSLGFAGSTGILSFTNGASGNLIGEAFVGDSPVANTAGVLNVTGGSVVTASGLSVGYLDENSVSGSVLVDGAGSRITQTGGSALTLGAGSLGSGTMTLSNGGVFEAGTGSVLIDSTGTLNTNSGGRFIGRTVELRGTANINGGLLFADHLQFGGGTVNTDAGSVVSVNTMTGLGNSTTLNGFVTFGEPAGAASASHTVSAGQTFDVGRDLVVGLNRLATFSIDGGAVTANALRIADTTAANSSLVDVINGGTLTVNDNARIGSAAGGAGTLTVSAGGSAAFGGTLRVFTNGFVGINPGAALGAHIIDVTGGGDLAASSTSTVAFNNLTGFGNTIAFGGNVRTGVDLGPGGGSHTVQAGQTFTVGGHMKIGAESGPASAQFNVDGGTLTVGEFFDIASNLNGSGRDTTFRVLNGGTVSNAGGIASSYGAAGGAVATLFVDGAGSRWESNTSVLNRGTMTVSNGGTYQANGTFTVRSGGTVNLNTDGRLIANAVNHVNGGTFNLNTGALVVETFNGDLINTAGTLAPGDTPGDDDTLGTTTINGDYTQDTFATLALGTKSDGSFDRLVVTGELALDGALVLTDDEGFAFSLGGHIDLLDWGTLSGAFETVTLFDLSSFNGLGWNTEDLYTTGEVSFEREGDLNTDGFVGAADLDIILANWNESTLQYDYSAGDVSGDGFVDGTDLAIIQGNWGGGTFPGGNIPEPGTAALLGLLGLAAPRRRRRAV